MLDTIPTSPVEGTSEDYGSSKRDQRAGMRVGNRLLSEAFEVATAVG